MAGGATIRLDGGPGHGQIYFEEDFRDRIKAVQRMHRTETGRGWALGYAPGGLSASGERLWTCKGATATLLTRATPIWPTTAPRLRQRPARGLERPRNRLACTPRAARPTIGRPDSTSLGLIVQHRRPPRTRRGMSAFAPMAPRWSPGFRLSRCPCGRQSRSLVHRHSPRR